MVHLVTPKIHSLQKKPTGFLCAAAPRRPTSFQETGMGGLGVQFSPTPLSHNGCPRLEMLAFAKCHKTEGQVQDSWKLNYMHFGMVWACWEILPCRAYSKTMRKTSCRPATPWLSNQPTEQPMYDFLQGKNYGKESLLSFLNFHSLTVQDLKDLSKSGAGKTWPCPLPMSPGSRIHHSTTWKNDPDSWSSLKSRIRIEPCIHIVPGRAGGRKFQKKKTI